MKCPFLLLCALTLGWQPLASAQEEPAAEERSFVGLYQGGLQSGIRAIPGVGDLAGDLLLGSEAAASLQIPKNILQTNTSTLEQIRAMASDALQVKRKIEEFNRLNTRERSSLLIRPSALCRLPLRWLLT